MGVLANLINSVATFINKQSDKIPSLNFPERNIGDIVGAISDCLYVANKIFPIDELLIILGILISFAIAMIGFYWIQRAINLLRGAG